MRDNKLTGLLSDLLVPPICPICGTATDGKLCSDCQSELTIFEGDICQRCGRPFSYGFDKRKISNRICILCKDKTLYFKQARSFSIYEGKLKKLVIKYRAKGYRVIEDIMAEMLLEAYKKHYKGQDIDCIDTHMAWMNGVAKSFSKKSLTPFACNIKRLKKGTNGAGSRYPYKLRDCLSVRDKKVLLLGDRLMSGKAINSVSLLLKKAAAESVSVLTVAMPKDRIWL